MGKGKRSIFKFMYTFDMFLNTAHSLLMYLGVMLKHSSAIVYFYQLYNGHVICKYKPSCVVSDAKVTLKVLDLLCQTYVNYDTHVTCKCVNLLTNCKEHHCPAKTINLKEFPYM